MIHVEILHGLSCCNKEGANKILTFKIDVMEQWKKAQAVLVPHNGIHTIITKYLPGTLSLNNDILAPHTNQHLYVVTDDKLQVGDFIYNKLSGIGKYIKNEDFNSGIVVIYDKQGFEVAEDVKNVSKILATTDSSLQIPFVTPGNEELDIYEYTILPQPSEQFLDKYIKAYNEGSIISDVLVKYNRVFDTIHLGKPGFPEDDVYWWIDKLDVDHENRISILISERTSWNKDELIEYMWVAYKAADTIFEDEHSLRLQFNSWIKKII